MVLGLRIVLATTSTARDDAVAAPERGVSSMKPAIRRRITAPNRRRSDHVRTGARNLMLRTA
jgi:hypothetical protein